MLWSGSSPLTVVRNGMWGLLLLTGVAWLAIGWSVLRLEPADIAEVAGPVLLFAAATEVVRAVAGTRTWWLNAGMALLFAATGAVLMTDRADSWTTPAALIGWYLLVRGAADIAISMMTRETDRVWGLLTVVGLVEVGLGFFAAGSFARTAEMVAVILGGAAVIRGVADLVASLRLREASAIARAERLLELPPERAIGVAGYSAGITDFEEAPARASRPRHRAMPRASASGLSDLSGPRPAGTASGPASPEGAGSGSFHDEVLRTTADLDAMLALAGVTGAAAPGAAAQEAEAVQVEVPDTPEGADLPGPAQITASPGRAESAAMAGREGAAVHGPEGMHNPGGAVSHGPGAVPHGSAGTAPHGGHGPAGTAPHGGHGQAGTVSHGAHGPAGAVPQGQVGGIPHAAGGAAPHGPEGVAMHSPGAVAAPGSPVAMPPGGAAGRGGHGSPGAAMPIWQDRGDVQDPAAVAAAASGHTTAVRPPAGTSQHGDQSSLPLLDPAARAARAAMPGMDDTSIIARGRLVD